MPVVVLVREAEEWQRRRQQQQEGEEVVVLAVEVASLPLDPAAHAAELLPLLA